MCGFIFAKTKRALTASSIVDAGKYLRYRGPDSSKQLHIRDADGSYLFFMHFLLDMSGRSVPQPITDVDNKNLVLLFNGEVYNYGSLFQSASDTEAIIPTFKSNPADWFKQLDGEFAVLIADLDSQRVSIATDPFLTKPLYIGRSSDPSEFGIATYASSLRALGFSTVQMLEPNAHYTISYGKRSISITEDFPSFGFSANQQSSDFSVWEQYFLAAVKKRALHGAHRPMVALSSGYDSGAIALALNLLKIPYETYSIQAGENQEILKNRLRVNSNVCTNATLISGLSKTERKRISNEIRHSVEPFDYVHTDGGTIRHSLSTDGGAIGAYAIAELAREKGIREVLSGCGADEIYSDYGFNGKKIYPHSEFGGIFPEELDGFFPWKKFYGDTQRSYLFKDEIIYGRHGIEGRYPFLDRDLVQAFLSLKAELKNAEYKAPLANFLRKHGYPFEDGRKRGFSPQKDPLLRRIRRKLRLV